MSVVVAYVSKNSESILKDSELAALCERLPLPQTCEKRYFNAGRASLAFFDYGAALDFKELPASTMDNRGFAQGEVTRHAANWLSHLFSSPELAADPLNNPESLIAVQIKADELTLFADCSGTQQFLYLETDEAWVFSNHQAILGRWLESEDICEEQFAWMVHKYHLHGFGHVFPAIKRTEPGAKYIVTPKGVQVVKCKSNRKEIYAPITDNDLPEMIFEVADEIADFIFDNPADVSLSISGGKDSRAILGLLGPRALEGDLSLWTWGEVYAPDVMAASALATVAGVRGKHKIGTPPLVRSSQDFAKQITNDLISDFSLSSLADIRPVPVRSSLQLGGHEFGLRQSATYPKREEYLASQKRVFDVSSMLSPLGRSILWDKYEQDLLEAVEDCPDSKLDTVARLNFRLPVLIASSLTSINAAASDFHPFLDYRFLRIVLGASPEFTEKQGIHYVLNRRYPAPIETVPFAGDEWPTALTELARDIGLPFRGTPQKPYRFNSAFPSQNSFGRYNWRIELFERMRPKVLEYLTSGAIENELIDLKAMFELVKRDSKDWSFTNFYQLGAILKMCLINELRTTVLDARNADQIEEVINSMFAGNAKAPRTNGLTESDSGKLLKAIQEPLGLAQESIRQLAEQIHDFEANEPKVPDLASLAQCLREETVTCEFVSRVFGQTLGAPNLRALRRSCSQDSHSFKLWFDENSRAVVSGFLLRPESHRALVAIRTKGKEDPIEGMAWSDAGFWYFYISENNMNGRFEKELRWEGHNAETVNAEAMAWYGDEAMFISLDQ